MVPVGRLWIVSADHLAVRPRIAAFRDLYPHLPHPGTPMIRQLRNPPPCAPIPGPVGSNRGSVPNPTSVAIVPIRATLRR